MSNNSTLTDRRIQKGGFVLVKSDNADDETVNWHPNTNQPCTTFLYSNEVQHIFLVSIYVFVCV